MRLLLRSVLATGLTVLAMGAASALAAGDPSAAEARELLKKAVTAAGGEKLTDSVGYTSAIKGTIHPAPNVTFGLSGEATIIFPDRQKGTLNLEVNGMTVTLNVLMDGNTVKASVGGMEVPLDDTKIAEAKEFMHQYRTTYLGPILSDPKYKLGVFGPDKVGDQNVIGVRVSYEGRRDVVLFFSKANHRLLRADTQVRNETTNEIEEQTTLYSEHKEFDGVLFPTKVEVKRNGKPNMSAEVSSFKPLDKSAGDRKLD